MRSKSIFAVLLLLAATVSSTTGATVPGTTRNDVSTSCSGGICTTVTATWLWNGYIWVWEFTVAVETPDPHTGGNTKVK